MSIAVLKGHRPLQAAMILALCMVATTSRAADVVARLHEHSGQVQIMRSGNGNWVDLKDGEEIHPGDRLKTLAKATATVEKTDGTTVEIMPLSEVTMVNERGFRVQLGRVWSRFVHAVGGKFFIETPTTTALIRGTVLSVSHDGSDSRVLVTEGLVSVEDRNRGSLDVKEGFAVTVGHGRLGRLERAMEKEMTDGRRFMDRVQRMPKFDTNRFQQMRDMRGPQAPGGQMDDRRNAPMQEHRGPDGVLNDRRSSQMEERRGPESALNERRELRTQAVEDRQDRQEIQQQRVDRHETRDLRRPIPENREMRERRDEFLREHRTELPPPPPNSTVQ